MVGSLGANTEKVLTNTEKVLTPLTKFSVLLLTWKLTATSEVEVPVVEGSGGRGGPTLLQAFRMFQAEETLDGGDKW